jgi:predicted MFS family arabinose efflux permease
MKTTEKKIKSFPNEIWILLVLAGLQFAHIVDFMIMMPLGPKLIRTMNINSHDFGALVSVYTFTAGITNLLGAFLLDRYDRKKSTLIIYGGFIVGTIACGFATNYAFLFAARSLAGAFGGLINASVMAIVGDYIPYQRRARAMGIVMASFSVASIAGVPLSIWLANKFDWHAPFFFVGGASVFFMVLFYVLIPPLTRHLNSSETSKSLKQSFAVIGSILKQRGPLRALGLIAVLMLSQFAIIPFLTTFYVFNLKFPESHIPLIYLVGGALTVVTSPLVGKLSDKYGRAKVFKIFLYVLAAPILILTNLGAGTSIWVVLSVSGLFFVASNGRFVPAMTMITSVVPSHRRGTFMSLVSCVQQVFAGVAAYWAGVLISETVTGELVGFDMVGYLAVVINFAALALGMGLERKALSESEESGVEVEPSPAQ